MILDLFTVETGRKILVWERHVAFCGITVENCTST